MLTAFLLALAMILYRLKVAFMNQPVELISTDRKLPFSTLLFNCWDFQLSNADAVGQLQSGVNVALKELLAEQKQIELAQKSRPASRTVAVIAARFVSAVLTVTCLGLDLYLIFLALFYQAAIERATFSLMTDIIITCINIKVGFWMKLLGLLERWTV
eukprot:TRINITY_DN6511_c0_g5_i1.p1 TRINITY_DN6511_c0_g5~~TRINITY_DN6511_c0_g5_i1.p1  ORF type:complete len:158 (+),score=36.13 TRINITY_DN6511_c0_g5_i1:262-735(+)